MRSTTPRYAIHDLDIGGDESHACGINADGWIVGSSVNLNPDEVVPCAWLWRSGEVVDLGLLPGDETGSARAINDAGAIAGWSLGSDGTRVRPRSFLWRAGALTELGSFDGSDLFACSINHWGQVAGFWQEPEGRTGRTLFRAFLWDLGQLIDLKGLYGGRHQYAAAINDAGQIVGNAETDAGVRHAVLWQNGETVDLGTPPGTRESYASSLNALGHVVGHGSHTGADARPFLWRDGDWIDLGTLGGDGGNAIALNGADQVVGGSSNYQGELRAFLWEDGVMQDLNDLIPPEAEWVLEDAVSINEAGQIVGTGLCRDAKVRELEQVLGPSDDPAKPWLFWRKKAFLLTPL